MKSTRVRFEKYVSRDGDGCWAWLGSKNVRGYGRLNVGGSAKLAHRLAYEFAHGEIPQGRVVCHTCDNPGCVNPRHLFVGTQYENMQDMARKGRAPDSRGEKCGKAKLTNGDVFEIRRRLASGESGTRIAEDFGVNHTTVYSIKNKKRWVHLVESVSA